MRVLITGGAGFLGSHLCDLLLEKGHEVIALDNVITGKVDNIAHLAENKNFTFITHDVSTFISIDGPIDAVMHFASPASPPDYLKYPIQTMKVGALGTHNALGLARAKNAKFFLASTSEVYGDPLIHPQTEDYTGNVNTIGPRGVYDEAKRFAEALTMAYHRQHNLSTRIVRIFNTYGPRMRIDDGRVVPNFVGRALRKEPIVIHGDGSQTRSFCYYTDLVAGIYRLLETEYHDPVNIGNPHEVSMIKLAELVNDIAKNPAGITFKEELRIKDDPQVRCPDITRARTVLGWEPTVSIEEGLSRTITFYKERYDFSS